MSICRPARCLFSKAAASSSLPKTKGSPPTRSFHTTSPRPARRRRPHYPSIKAEDLDLLNQTADTKFPKYDTSETKLLEKKYTPSQIAAIKAAETVIDPRDLVIQGQERTDYWRLPYEDDLAEVDAVTDHADKLSHRDLPQTGSRHFRLANAVERDAAVAKIVQENMAKMYPGGVPSGKLNPTQQREVDEAMEAAFAQAMLDPRATYYSKNPKLTEALADPRHSIVLADLPRIENRMVRQTRRISTDEEEDPQEKRLLLHMGWDKQKLRSIHVKTLVAHGVTNQTRMGKIRSMYYLTIAGNKDGLLGVGEGKSVEPEEARKQSVMAAIRSMRPVQRYEGRTIYGSLEKKVGATKVLLFSRPPGKSSIRLSTTIHKSTTLKEPANIPRFRTPHSTSDLRTRPRRWSPGSGRPNTPCAQ
jgi:small subunit ribosomal protein S5